MAEAQAASPAGDNLLAVGDTGAGGSALTAGKTTAATGTPPLAVGATEASPPAWMAQLPSDLKADQSLTKFATIGDLGKSYKELEGKLGKAVVLPDEKASAEEWAAYRKAIGVPEKSEDYKLEKVQLPEPLAADPKAAAEYLALAHKLNMTNDQVKAIHAWYYQNLARDMKVVKTTMAEAEAIMAKEMGADWAAGKTYMDRAFTKFADPETAKLFDRTGLGNHPGVIRMFIKMGKAISDHPFVEGRGEKTETDRAHILYPNQP